MEIKKCSNCGKIEEISTFDPVCRCECGGIFYNDEDYENQEINKLD